MAYLASPFLNVNFPRPETGGFLIRSARRYHHFKNTMGLPKPRAFTNFLGRLRGAGGSMKSASTLVRGDRLLRFRRGAQGAFSAGHRFFGNQYVRIGASRAGMRRETLKGLAQRKAEGFKSHDSRLARKATAFGKKLAGLSNERRFSWKKFN